MRLGSAFCCTAIIATLGCSDLKEGYDGYPCEGNATGLVFGTSLIPTEVADSAEIVESKHCSNKYPHCILYDGDKYACSENEHFGTLTCGGISKNVLSDNENCGGCNLKCDGTCTNGECSVNRVCEENAVECVEQGKRSRVCIHNAWEYTSCGTAGCDEATGACKEKKCDEEKVECAPDKTYVRVCEGNAWKTKGDPCPENAHCNDQSLTCKCDGDLTMCDGKCVDTKTDPNHCGVCGNKAPEGAGCSNGKICVKSGDYARSGVDYPGGCCDSGDESFVYLNGRSECKETKYLKDPNHNYSYPYCLASSQITSITSSSACITRNADINHLSDASSCGTTFSQDGNIKCPYSLHSTSSSEVISEVCQLGKCCFENGDELVKNMNCGRKFYDNPKSRRICT